MNWELAFIIIYLLLLTYTTLRWQIAERKIDKHIENKITHKITHNKHISNLNQQIKSKDVKIKNLEAYKPLYEKERNKVKRLEKEDTNLLSNKELHADNHAQYAKIVDNAYFMGDKVKVKYNGKTVIGDIVGIKYRVGGAGKKLYKHDEIEREKSVE